MLITGVRVQVPPRAPSKDADFDTMRINVSVLDFYLKLLKMAHFLTLLRKAQSLTW